MNLLRQRSVGWRRWRVLKTVQAGKSVYRATLAELIDALIQAEREGRLTEKIRFYAGTGGVGPARARTNLFIPSGRFRDRDSSVRIPEKQRKPLHDTPCRQAKSATNP